METVMAMGSQTALHSKRYRAFLVRLRRAREDAGLSQERVAKLLGRGQTWVSYTLVLDDNWPSRRTGEKLGCEVCGNYMVYRRNFRRSR